MNYGGRLMVQLLVAAPRASLMAIISICRFSTFMLFSYHESSWIISATKLHLEQILTISDRFWKRRFYWLNDNWTHQSFYRIWDSQNSVYKEYILIDWVYRLLIGMRPQYENIQTNFFHQGNPLFEANSKLYLCSYNFRRNNSQIK